MANYALNNQNSQIIYGSQTDDTVTLTGTGTSNSFFLSDGNDLIQAGTGVANYTTTTAVLGFGNDSITGGIGSNSLIYGNQGQDSFTFNVGASNISVYGGQGNDTVNVTAGTSYLIYGNLGDDTVDLGGINGGVGASRVYGGQGADQIVGSAGDDSIFGGLGNDVITANGLNAQIYGNQGDDSLSVGGNSASVFGGQGSDRVTLAVVNATNGTATFAQNELVYGNLGDDVVTVTSANSSKIYGGQGADTVTVAAQDTGTGPATATSINANNSVFGGIGADVINVNNNQSFVDGGDDNDIIAGSNSYTTITGGAGSDQLNIAGAVVNMTTTTPTTADHALTISDFVTGTDDISFGGAAGTPGNYSETKVTGGLAEAAAAAANLAANTYLFVAGTDNGYIFAGSGTGGVTGLQGATLLGLNSVADFDSTDIIGATMMTGDGTTSG